jgi:hypothetical protein
MMEMTFSATPAYAALVDTVIAIANAEGSDRALAWMQRQLDADFDLFMRIDSSMRPRLQLLQGGKA